MKKTIKYTWIVVRNLLTIGVVLLVFSRTNSNVETITVALLILLYVELTVSHAMSVRIWFEFANAAGAEFAQVRKLLNERASASEEEENPRAIVDMLKRTEAEYYINTFGAWIVGLIALGALILSL